MRWLAWSLGLLVFAPSALAQPRAVVLMVAEPERAMWSEALAVELAPQGIEVIPIDPPPGDTALERGSSAQRAARAQAAAAAVWMERAGPTWSVRVVGTAEDSAVRAAPLPRAIDARTAALISASLLEELFGGAHDAVLPERSAIVAPRSPPRSVVRAVLAIRGRELELAVGSREGVRVGDAVEIISESDERAGLLAVAEVIEVEDAFSMARLLEGHRIDRSTPVFARPSGWSPQMARMMIPPRPRGLRASAYASAFLTPESFDPEVGAGFAVDVDLAYHVPDVPLVFSAQLSPAGAGWAGRDEGYTYQAHAFVGLDLDWLGLDVGAGVAPFFDLGPSDWLINNHDAAASLAAGLRVGPIDGFRVRAYMSMLVMVDPAPGDHTYWGAAWGDVQLPVAPNIWILARGGGGLVGFVRAEAGPRFLLVGDLDSEAVIFSATAGVTFVRSESYSTMLGGPSVSAGLELAP